MSDWRYMLEKRRRFYSAIEQCRRERVCFCEHCEHGILPRYDKDCTQLLENSCKAHHTDTILAETSSVRGLSQFIPQQRQGCFRLMDLPVELRLRIYEIAFEPVEYQYLSPRLPSSVAEPALLRTNRQIRKEATSILYKTSCFRIELPELYDKRKTMDYLQGEDRIWLTHMEKLNKLKDLRHVCFRLCNTMDMHNLYIDLDGCSVGNWLIPAGDKTLQCHCQTPRQWTVLRLREHIVNTAHPTLLSVRMQRVLRKVDRGIELAEKAIEHFRALCVTKDGKLVTRLRGLACLAEAAWFVLDARSRWVDAKGYEGESDRYLSSEEESHFD